TQSPENHQDAKKKQESSIRHIRQTLYSKSCGAGLEARAAGGCGIRLAKWVGRRNRVPYPGAGLETRAAGGLRDSVGEEWVGRRNRLHYFGAGLETRAAGGLLDS